MKAPLTLLAGLSLLLAACAQQPEASVAAPTQTAPTQTATTSSPAATAQASNTLYELSFQGVRDGDLSVSARQVGAALGAQGLIDAPSGLAFKLLSASTFTLNPGTLNPGTPSSATRHVRVTYQVTNNTGSALSNLTFLPVNTDEDSAGPSNNNGSVPTVGNTPYKDVTYFDGSDASGKAASLTPVAGKQFNAATGTADSDANASAFLTGLDTTGLNATPPTGLIVADIKPQGWRVASSLATGASANVTLAVDLPLDPAGPSRDPFNFTLVFTSAQDRPVAPGVTAIHTIQGATPSGDAPSPLVNATVTTSGVVTAVYQGAGQLGGFFLQAPDAQADSDPVTSEGVFVYCGPSTASKCSAVSVGDAAQVTGTVQEFGKSTQIVVAASGDVSVSAGGQPLPTPVSLSFPLSSRAVLERSEGMRVTVPTSLTVTNNFGLGRYGQLGLSSGGRVFNPTNGQGGDAASNALRVLNIDDGVNTQNPASMPFLSSADPVTATRRTGDTVSNLTGVLNYSSPAADYLLYPTTPPVFADSNPRPAAPNPVGGSLKVAGANVLNYFTDLATTNAGCESTNGLDVKNSRGADTCAEFVRQQTKIVQVLRGLDADVITLMEVQNNGETALSSLRDALNAAYGSAVYSAVASGKLGTDAIKVAILYKSGSVTPVGTFITENPLDAGGAPIYSRPPLAQTFAQNSSNEKFSVIANHLKSKGSCPPAGSDPANQDNGQGCWNVKRTAQARQLLNFVQTVKTQSGDPDVLLLGDLNAYGDEDPINTLVTGGFESLNKRIPAPDRYSYQFNGNFGYLDHALSSASMSGQVSGVTEWHVNADEPVVLDYNTEFKVNPACTAASCTSPDLNNVPGTPTPFRASDHDPVLVGLSLTSAATPTFTLSASGNGAAITGQAYTLTISSSAAPDSLSVDWGDGSAAQGVTPSGTSVSVNHTYAAAGNFTVTVSGVNNTRSASATKALTVSAAATPSLSLSVSPASLSVAQGAAGNSTVTTSAANSGSPVALSASVSGSGSLPTVSLSPASVSGSANSTSTASVNVGSSVPAGTYTVTVTGTGEAGSKSASFDVTVTAAQTGVSKLVISELRFRGPSGAGDEFIELFNAGDAALDIGNWKVEGNTNNSAAFTTRATIPAGTTLGAKQFYLLVNTNGGTNGYSLATPSNQTYTLGVTDNRAVRLTDAEGAVRDLVGFASAGATSAALCEGSCIADAATANPAGQASYKRKVLGNTLQDTNVNADDFVFGATSANPQNLSSTWINQN